MIGFWNEPVGVTLLITDEESVKCRSTLPVIPPLRVAVKLKFSINNPLIWTGAQPVVQALFRSETMATLSPGLFAFCTLTWTVAWRWAVLRLPSTNRAIN